MKKYLLVNLDTCFIDGSWEETTQPKRLKKYFKGILFFFILLYRVKKLDFAIFSLLF